MLCWKPGGKRFLLFGSLSNFGFCKTHFASFGFTEKWRVAIDSIHTFPAIFLFYLRSILLFHIWDICFFKFTVFNSKIEARLQFCFISEVPFCQNVDECQWWLWGGAQGLSQHLPAGPGARGRPASLPFSLKGLSSVLLWRRRSLSNLLHRVTHTAQTGGSVAIDLFVRPSGPLPAWLLQRLPAWLGASEY